MTFVLKVLKGRDNDQMSGIKSYNRLEFSWYITTKFCSSLLEDTLRHVTETLKTMQRKRGLKPEI